MKTTQERGDRRAFPDGGFFHPHAGMGGEVATGGMYVDNGGLTVREHLEAQCLGPALTAITLFHQAKPGGARWDGRPAHPLQLMQESVELAKTLAEFQLQSWLERAIRAEKRLKDEQARAKADHEARRAAQIQEER